MYKTTLLGATILAVAASSWGLSARAESPGGQVAAGFAELAKTPLMTTDYVLDNTNTLLSQPLINTGSFTIGDVGEAVLTISNGGGVMTTPKIGKTGAILGDAAGSYGSVRLHPYNGRNAGAWEVGGDLLIGLYGTGVFYSNGYTIVQGDFDLGVHGGAVGTFVLLNGETASVQGQTRLGLDAGTVGQFYMALGSYGHASFNYGRQLQVGVHGAATLLFRGTGALAPTEGDGPGTIIIGSQDPSTNVANGNSIVVDNVGYYPTPPYPTTMLGGTMIINSSTHLSLPAQQNLLAVGEGGNVVLSEKLVIQNNAFVYLAGGEIDVPVISFLGNAQIIGNGIVNAPIVNGHVSVGGRAPIVVERGRGPLTITGDVSGPNSLLDIGRGTLALQGAVGGDVHIDFAPTLYRGDLQLSQPETMAGSIGNFNSLDNIELLNKLVVTHAYHDHGDGTGALSLTFSDGTFAQLNFVGSYSSTMFHVIADGTTGTRIYLK